MQFRFESVNISTNAAVLVHKVPDSLPWSAQYPETFLWLLFFRIARESFQH